MPLFGPNISKMKEKKDVEGLTKELRNRNCKVRVEAAKALGQLGYTTGLVKALKDECSEVLVEAIAALEAINPTSNAEVVESLFNILIASDNQAVWQKAFEALNKFDARDIHRWLFVGIKLLEKEGSHNALMCFEKIGRMTSNKDTLCEIGEHLFDHEQYETALGYFEKVTDVAPGDSIGWEHMGGTLEKLDRKKEAIECLEKTLQIEPRQKHIRGSLGRLYLEMGYYESLAALAKETLQFDPMDIQAYEMLSEALAFTGKLNEAESKLREALELLYRKDSLESSELCMVYYYLGFICLMRGHKERAYESFQKALDAQPSDEYAQETLESFEILNILGMILEGNAVERRRRLMNLTRLRTLARKGLSLTKDEIAVASAFSGVSPVGYMEKWDEGVWYFKTGYGVLLKLWPSKYLAAAAQIMPRDAFENLRKYLNEITQC